MTQRNLRLRGACAAAALLCGCGDGSPERARFSVRDSAGVEIVETHAGAWDGATAWRFTDVPLLTIGLEEGDAPYLFARIAGATRLDDGGIVVADGGSTQLRFFDAAGRFVKAVGREGKGPGEFEYIRGLKRCGADSLFAFDLSWQTKVYTPAGELVREMTLTDAGTAGFRTPYALGCSRDGRFVITGWGAGTGPPPIGFHRTTAPISVLDRDGAPVVRLGEFPSSERIGSEHGSRPHPFGRSTVVGIAGDRVYIGTAEALEVAVYGIAERAERTEGESARLTGLIRGPAMDLEIRQEHLDSYRASSLENVSAARRPDVERSLRDMPLPAGFASYTALEIDADGNLWLRRFLRPGETQQYWTVFRRDGVMLGDIASPARLTIVEIGADYVLGIHTDDMDVQRVQLYGIEK